MKLNYCWRSRKNTIAKSIDWESCVDKYGEILEAYSAHYPSPEDAAAIGKDFPHKKDELTRYVLTSKLKAIRSKYRQAIDNGRRSGHGRVVMIFYEHCSEIWGSSPATAAMLDGLESSENHEESSNQRSFDIDVDSEDIVQNRQVRTLLKQINLTKVF